MIIDSIIRQIHLNEYTPWVKEYRKAGIKTQGHISRRFIEPFGNKFLIELTPITLDHRRTQRRKNKLTVQI